MDISETIKYVIESEANELLRLKDYVDYKVVEEIVKEISDCKGKIVVTGCGTSAAAAKKIVHSLSVINVDSVYLNPSDAVHGSLGIVKSEDIVIFISKGGSTKELTNFVDNVKEKESKIITVTENYDSLLALKSDHVLVVKILKEPDSFNMLATASTLSVISIFDAICIAIMKYKQFDLDTFAINHPSGAVGDRLLNKDK